MSFDSLNAALSAWSDSQMGTAFTYNADATELKGVFSQPTISYEPAEFGTRKLTRRMVVTDKAQWTTAGLTPANLGTITSDGTTYTIEDIDGTNDSGEPAYTLHLFVQT